MTTGPYRSPDSTCVESTAFAGRRLVPVWNWTLGLALLLALTAAAGCRLPIEPGVWSIEGTDPAHGPYLGTLEIRPRGGGLDVIRVIRFASTQTGDGRRINTVWTGRCDSKNDHAAIATFSLDRAVYISRARGLTRTETDRTPLEVTGRFTKNSGRDLFIEYRARSLPDFLITENGVLAHPVGPEPIWRSDRSLRPTFGGGLRFRAFKSVLFRPLEGYHNLPEMRPSTRERAFRKAIPHTLVDRTDLEFYRENPDQIRLVNKVLDPISLVEEEIRANALRSSLADKAAFFQGTMDTALVGLHGLVLSRESPLGPEQPDFDGALWTGIYVYTQALRHQLTGDAGALGNLRHSLRGIFTLMDITGDSRTFARTLRLSGPPLGNGWVRGEGEYSHLDWLAGGNNDMSKGLMLGIIAGWEGLPVGDLLRESIPRRAANLLELCQFSVDPSVDCRSGASNLNLPSVNPGIAKLLAGVTNQNPEWIEDGHVWLRHPLLMAWADRGGGPVYFYGFSDWSGNHLTLVNTLVLQWILNRTGDRHLESKWIKASANAWRVVRPLEQPLHAALAVASDSLDDPEERAEAHDQALWGLRSFPAPKHSYPVDHRIRENFVMSPFPSLPWKFDWETNPERLQSLAARGIIEGPMTSYLWVGNPFSFVSDGTGDDLLPGVDYLFLYWIARIGGLISASD